MGRGFLFWFLLVAISITLVLIVGGGIYLATEQGALDLSGPPDMETVMTASPENVAVGGEVTYTINYTNVGASPAGSVKMTITMPQGLTVGRIVPASPCKDSGGTIACNLGTRQPGTTGQVTVTATVGSLASGTSMTANANVTVGTTRDERKEEEELANNSASASATVQ